MEEEKAAASKVPAPVARVNTFDEEEEDIFGGGFDDMDDPGGFDGGFDDP